MRRADIFIITIIITDRSFLGGAARACTHYSGGYDLININATAPPFVQAFIVMLYTGPFYSVARTENPSDNYYYSHFQNY